MGFRQDIRALYRADPHLSGAEVLERLGRKGTPQEWKMLTEEQVKLRGNRPAARKNRSKGPLNSWRGAYLKGKRIGGVRFIPPKQS